MPSVVFKNTSYLSISQGKRPAANQLVAMNTSSIQWTRGLVACYPMWEAQGGPIKDYGPNALADGVVYTNAPTVTNDATMGNHPVGGGNGAGGGTLRAYRIPWSSTLQMLGEGMSGHNWAISFWFRSLVTNNPGSDSVIYSFCNTTTPFSGIAGSMDTSQQVACNTNGSTLIDAGIKATKNVFTDLAWHHFLFTQTPSASNNSFSASNKYFVDGAADTTSTGGVNSGATTQDCYLLGNNQGDAPGDCAICDLRFYKDSTFDLTLAQSLYNQATRWELYLI
jgi:hypothetical protein